MKPSAMPARLEVSFGLLLMAFLRGNAMVDVPVLQSPSYGNWPFSSSVSGSPSGAPSGCNGTLVMIGNAAIWDGDIFGQPQKGSDALVSHEWVALCVVISILVVVDILVLQPLASQQHGRRIHLAILAFWICIGLAFNAIVWYRMGHTAGCQWFSGYFLEWLLSMDNLFVFHLIFTAYKTPRALRHKALFMGVLGALLFRMASFLVVSRMLRVVRWLRMVFGVALVYSGIRSVQDESDVDVEDNSAVRFLTWLLGPRLVLEYDEKGQSLFMLDAGELRATLLVPVVLCLETTDLLFAVDSVSAKVTQIPDSWICFSSSVLAIFGCRALFFVLQELVEMFEILKYGLCVILVFIGLELMASDYVQLPSQVVCEVILFVFVVCITVSFFQSMWSRARADRGASAICQYSEPAGAAK